MRYSVLNALLLSTLVVTGCGCDGSPKKPTDTSSNKENNTNANNTNTGNNSTDVNSKIPDTTNNQSVVLEKKITATSKQYIKKVKALDSGFAFAGENIVGGTLNGVQWYSQEVSGRFYDVDGENLKYSAISYFGLPCGRVGVPITMDGGKTWIEADKNDSASCGIENDRPKLLYSNNTWLWATPRTARQSIDGTNYKYIFLSYDKKGEPTQPLSQTASSLKLSGRTKGNVLVFNGETIQEFPSCSTVMGVPPFTGDLWKRAGSYTLKGVQAGKNNIGKCPAFSGSVAWAPNKPYIQFMKDDSYYNYYSYNNEGLNGYVVAPIGSDPKNWEWTYHHYPKQYENDRINAYDMFWAGDSLVMLSDHGIHLSQDQGETWELIYSYTLSNYVSSNYDKFSSGDWNPKTGMIALATSFNVYTAKIPNLKNAGPSALDYNGESKVIEENLDDKYEKLTDQKLERSNYNYNKDKIEIVKKWIGSQYYIYEDRIYNNPGYNILTQIFEYTDYKVLFGDNFDFIFLPLNINTSGFDVSTDKRSPAQKAACVRVGQLNDGYNTDSNYWETFIKSLEKSARDFPTIPYGSITINVTSPSVHEFTYRQGDKLNWDFLISKAKDVYQKDVTLCQTGKI